MKKNIDNAWVDIASNFEPFLKTLHECTQILKVPGRKAKCKFQVILIYFCKYSLRAIIHENYVLSQAREDHH